MHLNLTALDVDNGTFLIIERFQFNPGSELNNIIGINFKVINFVSLMQSSQRI